MTPLMWAAYNNNPLVTAFLLSQGADCEEKDMDGFTAMHWCVCVCVWGGGGGGGGGCMYMFIELDPLSLAMDRNSSTQFSFPTKVPTHSQIDDVGERV